MDSATSGGTWPACTSISVPRLIPEQMLRTSASSSRGRRAGSVRRTPCRGAIVQYAVQRSVAMSCIVSLRDLAGGGGGRSAQALLVPGGVRFPPQSRKRSPDRAERRLFPTTIAKMTARPRSRPSRKWRGSWDALVAGRRVAHKAGHRQGDIVSRARPPAYAMLIACSACWNYWAASRW